ncbi:hypothetical protein JTE88_04675 [Arcanobacterium phocisimile]|uniref:Uncharacterized protein n=1 Tax=Arcanobacterium phocisimile TaxID=1302235 RepID=A0ABX7IE42_9ACTO|nr:hypothetical protein [Arcanobacterium phocisimile]QRV01416.1 hypothetical protein JTE88_04675 [Arcanobacterium phocisimile]
MTTPVSIDSSRPQLQSVPGLVVYSAVVGILGGLSALVGLFLPFLSVSNDSLVTTTGDSIEGSYFATHLVNMAAMGWVLVAVSITVIILAGLLFLGWKNDEYIALIMAAILAGGSYAIVFVAVYHYDHNIQHAYELGAGVGAGFGMIATGATLITLSGISVFVAGMRQKKAAIRREQPVTMPVEQ